MYSRQGDLPHIKGEKDIRSISIKKYSLWRNLVILISIAVNVLLSYIVHVLQLPFYLDTAGTVVSSALGGVFSGIITAVMTNLLCNAFNPLSMFYSLIGVLIAVCTAWFFRRHRDRQVGSIFLFILTLALLGGVQGTVFQWALLGGPQFEDVAYLAGSIAGGDSGTGFFFASMLINIGLNIADKGICSGAAFLVLYFIPAAVKKAIRESCWMQKPPTDEEIARIARRAKSERYSLQKRMTVMLTVTAFGLALILSWISVRLSYESTKEEYKKSAVNAAEFAASVVNPYMIENYLRDGREAPGYNKTEETMYRIRDGAPGVVYLYILRVEDDGCRFIFDLEADDGEEPFDIGDFSPFEEAFEPYVDALKAGEEIEPIESIDRFGWLITAYAPIRDLYGNTVAYAGADASMSYVSDFVRNYLLRFLLIFSGFMVLILAYGQWTSGYFLIYPTGSVAAAVEAFMQEGVDQDQDLLDDTVRGLRALDIRTGDEIERLYNAICKMASNTAEQMRSMRHYSEATAQMQNGLIVTMADMVESRDSDTGAHVQKTAAYVRIILEGLKRKGYYAGKLTPKFMTDCESSAPLHDVGKINIPDAVLNKPGKLTDEEFEIMKTHTTAGREIMEKAINTVKGGSYLKEARNMAGYHHERWDGKGYPEGLHGEVIPLSARIMAVADVFDALTSPRVYKPAFPLEKALEIITEGAGKQFDPKVVEVFMDALPEVKLVLKKYNGTV